MNSFETQQKPGAPIETYEGNAPHDPEMMKHAFEFLGDQYQLIDPAFIEQGIEKANETKKSLGIELRAEGEGKKEIQYDKYKKRFNVEGEDVSMGTIIGSRHWGTVVTLLDSLDQFGEGKRLRKQYIEKSGDDAMFAEFNYELGNQMAEKSEMKDMMKAAAYREVRDRARPGSGQEQKTGVMAEQIMIGVLEGIAIDRPDLGISVLPGNAYQDVEEKIDFIIRKQNKLKGVGVEEKDLDTTIGIQFTTDTRKETHDFKKKQIEVAKSKKLDVDDIIYVAIDMGTLRGAVHRWESAGKPIGGPWTFLDPKLRSVALQELFKNLLTESQIQGLSK